MSDPVQRDAALARANKIRLKRAALKRAVRAGETAIQDLLTEAAVQNVRLGEVLTWPKRWGHTRARRLLRQVGASEHVLVKDMTKRQRQALELALSTKIPESDLDAIGDMLEITAETFSVRDLPRINGAKMGALHRKGYVEKLANEPVRHPRWRLTPKAREDFERWRGRAA